MKNIFSQDANYDEKVKKNAFDLSHRENITLDFGKIYPLGQPVEVLPGDKVDLSYLSALHAMPLNFPVQTPMTFKTFAFYVPNRILWDEWEDYITGVYDDTTKKPVHPWHKFTSQDQFNKMIGSVDGGIFCSGLLDYLGVPTTEISLSTITRTVDLITDSRLTAISDFSNLVSGTIEHGDNFDPQNPDYSMVLEPKSPTSISNYSPVELRGFRFSGYASDANRTALITRTTGLYPNSVLRAKSAAYRDVTNRLRRCTYETYNTYYANDTSQCYGYLTKPLQGIPTTEYINFFQSHLQPYAATSIQSLGINLGLCVETSVGSNQYRFEWFAEAATKFGVTDAHHAYFELDTTFLSTLETYASMGLKYQFFIGFNDPTIMNGLSQVPYNYTESNEVFSSWLGTSISLVLENVNSDPMQYDSCPYTGNTPARPLNALPARCYESICRSYFRNDKVNPFLDANGEPIYNKYIRNSNGGADTEIYDFYYANYELDAYTSAVPTPQFGEAPLVGLTITSGHTAVLNFDASNIVGTSPQSTGGTLQAEVEFTDDNNMRITGINSYDDELPSANLHRLMQQINYGISINDIRNVNAFQRFKERMQRRSYRYKDQIKNHFGQNVSNVAVDMPQYIGGYNFDIQVNKVNNNAAPMNEDGAPLGDYAGQASIYGKMNRTITHHCDEHGFIMVVGYVVPRPTYTQLLPKVFTKITDKFDYFTPEFGKIGFVPITNDEVCPIQAHQYDLAHGTDTIHDVFGYQRAWYDYMQMTDGAHGNFRYNLADYLAMRLFSRTPQLNARFIECHDEDVNNIFSVQSGDHFLGFVDYTLHIQRPIPRFAVPSIE